LIALLEPKGFDYPGWLEMPLLAYRLPHPMHPRRRNSTFFTRNFSSNGQKKHFSKENRKLGVDATAA
jgi:hypothetical protein